MKMLSEFFHYIQIFNFDVINIKQHWQLMQIVCGKSGTNGLKMGCAWMGMEWMSALALVCRVSLHFEVVRLNYMYNSNFYDAIILSTTMDRIHYTHTQNV